MASQVLLFDTGNTLTGQTLSDATQGAVMVEAMNRLGYTAMAIGERELQIGVKTIEARIKEAKFPILAANVTVKATGKLLTEPYTVVQAGKVKVGILGLTNDNAGSITNVAVGVSQTPVKVDDWFVVSDPVKAAAKYVPEIAAKADLVIVLSHLGVEADQRLAQQVPGIAVIVGGLTRRVLSPPLVEKGALVVQAGYDGEWLGALRLQLDEKGAILQHEGLIIGLGPEKAEHPDIARWLEEVKRKAP